jgi:activator of HSP90 ATPase
MLKPITQSVHFPATASQLYKMFINPKLHAAFTGSPVKISPKPASPFTAFNGMLIGSTLLTIPSKQIIQHWRSTHWKKTDLDSTLILTFTQDANRGRIDLVHANVPNHDHAGVTNGWKKYYWKPLLAYLKSAR